jgi:hypothetical protein
MVDDVTLRGVLECVGVMGDDEGEEGTKAAENRRAEL